ncbi:lipopolysaccharide biosynthesis protein [Paenibacillus sp. J2TS4]|uniref:lipopolysaccharide biosynthesis protein n=1 Tax=Paenibacillus sp. J2TS4 TaxID=2807194 RepID=UPI001B0A1987|nr:oligosaccharide flippase family protein [Paenibacillus sp. J2TS4]GIP36198.1 hypothetical protein J2TS4_54080 [Paenibacillus sp. J2TS4]
MSNSKPLLRKEGLAVSLWSILRSFHVRKDSTANSLKVVVVSMLIMAVNLLTGILTARYLGPAGKGESSALLLWPTFLANLFMLGLPSSLLFNMKKHSEEAASLYTTALMFCFSFGALAWTVGVAGVPYGLSSHSEQIIRYAQWFMISAPVLLIEFMNNAALQARGEFQLFNRIRMLPHVGALLWLFLLLFAGRLTPLSAALAYSFTTVPVTLWLTFRMLSIYRFTIRRWKDSLAKLFRYGRSSSGADVLNALSGYMDQVIVVTLLMPADLGLYLVAFSLSRVINVIHSSLVMVLFPKAAGLEQGEAVVLVKRIFRISLCLTMLAAIPMMLLGTMVLNVLYGEQYVSAVPVFRILVLEAVIGGSTLILAQSFMSLGKPGYHSMLQAVGMGAGMLLMLVMVPQYGLISAGIALLTGSIIRLLLGLGLYKKVLHTTMPRMLIRWDDLRWLYSRFASVQVQSSDDKEK